MHISGKGRGHARALQSASSRQLFRPCSMPSNATRAICTVQQGQHNTPPMAVPEIICLRASSLQVWAVLSSRASPRGSRREIEPAGQRQLAAWAHLNINCWPHIHNYCTLSIAAIYHHQHASPGGSFSLRPKKKLRAHFGSHAAAAQDWPAAQLRPVCA